MQAIKFLTLALALSACAERRGSDPMPTVACVMLPDDMRACQVR